MWLKSLQTIISIILVYKLMHVINTQLVHIIEYLFVMWSEKTHHMVQIDFGVIGIMWKFQLSSFQNFLLGFSLILVPKVNDVQRLWKIKKNFRVMLIFFILQLQPLRHVTGFPRSHHIYIDMLEVQRLTYQCSFLPVDLKCSLRHTHT